MVSKFAIDGTELSMEGGYKLQENEVVQFRLPNLKTTITYPAYVNYYVKLDVSSGLIEAIPATFMTLADYLTTKAL